LAVFLIWKILAYAFLHFVNNREHTVITKKYDVMLIFWCGVMFIILFNVEFTLQKITIKYLWDFVSYCEHTVIIKKYVGLIFWYSGMFIMLLNVEFTLQKINI